MNIQSNNIVNLLIILQLHLYDTKLKKNKKYI
jgi:hypothetical protein